MNKINTRNIWGVVTNACNCSYEDQMLLSGHHGHLHSCKHTHKSLEIQIHLNVVCVCMCAYVHAWVHVCVSVCMWHSLRHTNPWWSYTELSPVTTEVSQVLSPGLSQWRAPSGKQQERPHRRPILVSTQEVFFFLNDTDLLSCLVFNLQELLISLGSCFCESQVTAQHS